MIDSHCHLTDDKFKDDVDLVVKNFEENGIEKVLNMSTSILDAMDNNAIAKKHKNVYYAVGVHPEDVDGYNEEEFEYLLLKLLGNSVDKVDKSKLSDEDCAIKTQKNNIKKYEEKFKNIDPVFDENGKNKLLAIGEIGLDYYWTKDNKQKQIEVFESQIKLAKKYNLPFVVHNRDASGDVLEILKRNAPYNRTNIIHCFSASLEFANEVFKLGFVISFAGSVTFKNSKKLQEIARSVPLDKFLVETDSPYLTPEPFRGQRNEPANVKETANVIAILKNISLEQIDKYTTNNFNKIFNFK